tara:strand:- start:765 stop:1382 length:618 start_codon:yes stop_codon:yes gene_type:complete
MTAKIKLNAASGGGSVSLQGPSSSSNDRVFTLPDTADATLLTTNSTVGKIHKLISTTKTDVFSTQSTSMVDVTGMTLSITPASSSNKIFISTTVCIGHDSGAYPAFNLLRDSTHIAVPTGNAVMGGSARNTSFGPIGALDSYKLDVITFNFLDEPGDTNTHTYKLQISNGQSNKNTQLNKPISFDNAYTYPANGVSTFTLMEVAP